MASKFGYNDEEEDVLAPTEPQVTSSDPVERKAARALRIKRRQEAIKRANQPPEEAVLEEEVGLIERSSAEAAEQCQRLALDGAAQVTNVKVTTDEREVFRRTVYAQRMKESMEKIEEEAAEAQLQYDAITANWEAMMAIKDPLDIDAAMKEQKLRCDELLKEKDDLIDQLKADLVAMDVAYYNDLSVQDNDIKELSDRIEKQVTIMQRAYEKQLTLIEAAINIEREAMVDHNNKRWESLYRLRDKEELQHINYKEKQLEEFKEEIEKIMWDHYEKYRRAKIELETLLQELQKELEKLKATCLINTEKIGYNYQVLKKREEENVFVRSQQKRKLNKMADITNALRMKIRKASQDGNLEEINADKEIQKLMVMMDELEKKARHFAQVNDYKVWRMSAARCAELARRLRHAEVAMHAHILSEPPPPPPPKPPKSPLLKPDPAATPSSSHVQGEPEKTTVATLAQIQRDMKNEEFKDAKDKLVRHILQLVADNTGFLIEDRLFKLIEKYQLSSRNLCTLDAIFMALEIQAEEDIELLCKTFMDYAFCPICVGMEDALTSEAADQGSSDADQTQSMRGRASSVRARASIARSMSTSTSRSGHVGFRGNELSPGDQLLALEAEEIIQKCGDPQAPPPLTGVTSDAGVAGAGARRAGARGVTVSAQPDVAAEVHHDNPFLCPDGHYLEIEPMQVLTALGEFVSVFVPPEKQKLYDILDSVKPPDFSTPSRNLKAEDIETYWAAWKNVFPAEKDRFWDGFITALNKYLIILQEREKLHEEVVMLRRRNAALRQLIRGTLPQLPVKIPHYARPAPAGIAAPTEQISRLPPI